MGSILEKVGKIYKANWAQVGPSEKFDDEDLKLLTPTSVVVKSTYGTSLKLTFTTGEFCYIPLSVKCETVPVGTEVDNHAVEVILLHKEGHDDIIRAVVPVETTPSELPAEESEEEGIDFDL